MKRWVLFQTGNLENMHAVQTTLPPALGYQEGFGVGAHGLTRLSLWVLYLARPADRPHTALGLPRSLSPCTPAGTWRDPGPQLTPRLRLQRQEGNAWFPRGCKVRMPTVLSSANTQPFWFFCHSFCFGKLARKRVKPLNREQELLAFDFSYIALGKVI